MCKHFLVERFEPYMAERNQARAAAAYKARRTAHLWATLGPSKFPELRRNAILGAGI